jgi:hypothetical protein
MKACISAPNLFNLSRSDLRSPELSWAAHLSLNMVMSAPIPRRGIFEFAQALGSVVLKVMGPLVVCCTVVPGPLFNFLILPLTFQVCIQIPLVWSDSVTSALARVPRGSGGCDATSPWHAWAAVRTLTEGCRSYVPLLFYFFGMLAIQQSFHISLAN